MEVFGAVLGVALPMVNYIYSASVRDHLRARGWRETRLDVIGVVLFYSMILGVVGSAFAIDMFSVWTAFVITIVVIATFRRLRGEVLDIGD